MHDMNHIWMQICDPENIRGAICAVLGYSDPAKHLDRLSPARRKWAINIESKINEVRKELLSESYDFGKYLTLTITHPKLRTISYHDELKANVLESCVLRVVSEIYLNSISKHSYGALKGGGPIRALMQLRELTRSNPNAYFVQIDFRKYYQSIDKNLLKRRTCNLFGHDNAVCRFIWRVIDSFDEGIPIGIPFSQYNANWYLTPMDEMLERNNDVIGFIRYMDDIVAIVLDKQSAHRVLNAMKIIALNLHLSLKPNSRIAPVRCGIDAMGYVIYPTHVRLRKRIKQRMKKKSRRLINAGVSDAEYKFKMSSYYGWCKFADARHLLQAVMGERLKLFNKMKYKRKSELKPMKFFGLDKSRFVSMLDLDGVEILILETAQVLIKGEHKVAIKFCFTNQIGEDPDESRIIDNLHYTITKSEVIKDRLAGDSDIIPFAATMVRVNNRYMSYK